MRGINYRAFVAAFLWSLAADASAAQAAGASFDIGQRILNGVVENLGLLVPAALALLILYLDHRLKRRMYDDSVRERAEHGAWLKQSADEITEVGHLVAKAAAQQLGANPSWAVEALERAKLGPYAQTVFGERLAHFRLEKDALSKMFMPLLFDRCRRHADRGKNVFLVIDSGTTLFPFFEVIGSSIVNARLEQETWIKQITVVTNNLPGVEALIEHGRVNPGNRHAELEVACRLLPGIPLPIYSAVTGDDTTAALQAIKDREPNAVFIGLLTGNWIRIRSTNPRCPVPLARGKGHLEFKQKLVEVSDEIYVVTPLGKVFVNKSLDDLNAALGFRPDAIRRDKLPYNELRIDDKTATRVRMISTLRTFDRLLYAHGEVVRNALQAEFSIDEHPERFAKPSDVGCHIMFSFDQLPDTKAQELREEFPHQATRRGELLQECFQVRMPN